MSLENRLTSLTVARLTAVLLCAAPFMAPGAIAAPNAEEPIHLSYVKADLESPEGAKALYLRIQKAARMVCLMPDKRELMKWEVYQRCYDGAVAYAVEQVNASELTALHRSKTQRHAAG